MPPPSARNTYQAVVMSGSSVTPLETQLPSALKSQAGLCCLQADFACYLRLTLQPQAARFVVESRDWSRLLQAMQAGTRNLKAYMPNMGTLAGFNLFATIDSAWMHFESL